MLGVDAVLAAGLEVRRRAALGRSPAPEVRPRSLAGLDCLDDVFDPVMISGDVAKANEHLVGALGHRDHRIQVRRIIERDHGNLPGCIRRCQLRLDTAFANRRTCDVDSSPLDGLSLLKRLGMRFPYGSTSRHFVAGTGGIPGNQCFVRRTVLQKGDASPSLGF